MFSRMTALMSLLVLVAQSSSYAYGAKGGLTEEQRKELARIFGAAGGSKNEVTAKEPGYFSAIYIDRNANPLDSNGVGIVECHLTPMQKDEIENIDPENGFIAIDVRCAPFEKDTKLVKKDGKFRLKLAGISRTYHRETEYLGASTGNYRFGKYSDIVGDCEGPRLTSLECHIYTRRLKDQRIKLRGDVPIFTYYNIGQRPSYHREAGLIVNCEKKSGENFSAECSQVILPDTLSGEPVNSYPKIFFSPFYLAINERLVFACDQPWMDNLKSCEYMTSYRRDHFLKHEFADINRDRENYFDGE